MSGDQIRNKIQPRFQQLIMGEPRYRIKRQFALLRGEKPQLETAKVLQKPVSALPGCQQINVNTVLCDDLGLAEKCGPSDPW